MSSILKALKKLEQEKSGRFPDSLKIDSDILRTADSSRRFSPLILSLLLMLVFGGGAAVAVFFMKEKTAPQETTAVSPVQTVERVISLPPPARTVPETLPAEIVVAPARRDTAGDLPRKRPKSPAVTGKAVNNSVNTTIRTAVAERAAKPAESNGTAFLPAPPAVPALRVTGIAFQNSPADSMAIVNGMPVSSGSVIEGITVVEVRKDRVLFQRNGDKFEIQLGQSNR